MKQTRWEHMGNLWPNDRDFNLAKDKPALAVHRGKLWCIWHPRNVIPDIREVPSEQRKLVESHNGLFERTLFIFSTLDAKAERWSEPKPWLIDEAQFPGKARPCPALASVNGVLHCLYTNMDNVLIHATYAEDKQQWVRGSNTGRCGVTGILALAVFDGLLVCVFQNEKDSELWYQSWNPQTSEWSYSFKIGHSTKEAIDLTIIKNELFLVFSTYDNYERQMCLARWCGQGKPFSEAFPAPQWSSKGFAMDTDSDNYSIAAFRSTGYKCSGGGLVIATQCPDGTWLDEEVDVRSQEIISTPGLRFFNSMAICVWLNPEGGKQEHNGLNWGRRMILNSSSDVMHPSFWMINIQDPTPIASLSIPGTHDSGSIKAKSLLNWAISDQGNLVACQSMTLSEQLNSGIRYFDIRVNYWSYNDHPIDALMNVFSGAFGIKRILESVMPVTPPDTGLYIAHGPYFFQTLKSAFDEYYSFLDSHPSEGIVVQFKHEGAGNSEETFTKIAALIQSTGSKYWRLNPDLPTMGQLRGKIQLLRRCGGTIGIDLTNWPGNTTNDLTTPFAHRISDHYVVNPEVNSWPGLPDFQSILVTATTNKEKDVLDMMNDMDACSDPKKLHLTYTNFSAIAERGKEWTLSNPHTTAFGFNRILGALVKKRMWRNQKTGILAMDFPESERDLITNILRSNPGVP